MRPSSVEMIPAQEIGPFSGYAITVSQRSKERSLHVFVSHSHEDYVFARKVRDSLAYVPGIGPVFSDDMIGAGESWTGRVRRELSKADVFIVLVTPHSLHSKWVLTELGAAWANEKRIVPIVSDPDSVTQIPVPIHGLHGLTVDDLDNPEELERVLTCHMEAALP